MKRFSVRIAIAESFGIDFADVENDHRYQDTRTPCAVYTFGNDYYTATNSLTKIPKGRSDYNWVPCEPLSGYIPENWQLWIRKVS